MQKLSNVLCCARLKKGSVLSGSRSNQSDMVGPPTPWASPELMKHSNASDFRKTQCLEPGEVFLAIFTRSNCIRFAGVGAVTLSTLIRKDIKPWEFSAGQLPPP